MLWRQASGQPGSQCLNPLFWDKQELHWSALSTFVDISSTPCKNLPSAIETLFCLSNSWISYPSPRPWKVRPSGIWIWCHHIWRSHTMERKVGQKFDNKLKMSWWTAWYLWWKRGLSLNVTYESHSPSFKSNTMRSAYLSRLESLQGICPWRGGAPVLHAQLCPRAISHFSAAPQSPARLSGPHRQLS